MSLHKRLKMEYKVRVRETSWSWIVLVGCFLCRLLTDGIIGSLGVFIIAWQEYFPGSLLQLTWTLSLLAGITYIVGPLGSVLCKRYSIRQVVMGGAILCSSSFMAASMASQLWHLYVSFALAGVGLGLSYQPSWVVLTYYFDQRLGRTSGIASSGSAFGMFILPPLIQIMISTYSWSGALLILAGMESNIAVAAALYRPTRVEIAHRTNGQYKTITDDCDKGMNFQVSKCTDNLDISTKDICAKNIGDRGLYDGTTAKSGASKSVIIAIRSVSESNKDIQAEKESYDEVTNGGIISSLLVAWDLTVLKNVNFVLILMSCLIAGVYIIPWHYLSARAVQGGVSSLDASYLVSIMGASSLVFRVSHGFIIDHQILSAASLTALSYLVSCIACFATPLLDSYAFFIVISITMGACSGIFNSTVSMIAKDAVGLRHVNTSVGWMLLMAGIGVIIGSYLTGMLFDATGSFKFPFFFAATCFMVCSLLVASRPLSNYVTKMFRTLKTLVGHGRHTAHEL